MEKPKIEDYRIGNLISVNNKVKKLTLGILSKKFNDIEPIKITGDNLKKLGFRFVPNASQRQIYYKEGFHVQLLHGSWTVEMETVNSYHYVHEIQNLVYANTGEEVSWL